jgi:hypothetical protein
MGVITKSKRMVRSLFISPHPRRWHSASLASIVLRWQEEDGFWWEWRSSQTRLRKPETTKLSSILTTWHGLVLVLGLGTLAARPRAGTGLLENHSEKGRLNVFNSLQVLSTTYGLFQQLTRNFALEAI